MPPPYPSKKTDKDALYAATVAGIAANPIDYPSGLGGMFTTLTLSARIATKSAAVLDRLAKESAFRVAVQVENDAYTACDNEEQRLLALAEAQFALTAPTKLLEIGWGPRSDPTSIVPGQPRVLEAFPQGTTSLTLDWKPPAATA